MEKHTGNLRMMEVKYENPIQYKLKLGEELIDINGLIGRELHLEFEKVINCKICGEITNKSFGQGFCYNHFMNAPENSPCIINPELCEGHEGKGRDVMWEIMHHVKPHVVYLALTSAVKVGITRVTNTPNRWINQGAWQVIRLAEVPYRQLSGQIEVALKEHLTDKTPWQSMLKDIRAEGVDLLQEKQRIAALLPEELQQYISANDEIHTFDYPVEEAPEKVKSLNFDKVDEIKGTLKGVRGQYLIFDEGRVFNVRRHTGYLASISF